MNRLVTIGGIGTAIGVAAIVGGLGVAFADDDDDNGSTEMMDSGAMQMVHDPAVMERHMKDILGEDTYATMHEAMTNALGTTGYEQMLDKMAAGCMADGMGMMTPGAAAPNATGHSAHHSGTN